MREKEVYESPTLEVTEFEIRESIAVSNATQGVGNFEWLGE